MNRSQLNDEELVRRVRAAVKTGDARDFEILVRRHATHVLANCRHLTRSPDDAEDLAQDVFVKAYFALERFEGRSQFRTWLQRIKINHCLNFVRARNGRQFVDVNDGALEADARLHEPAIAEASLMAADARADITAVLDSMASTLRVPLILRDSDELPYDEIARTLGVSLSAAKMRVMRARQVFRQRYRERIEAQEAPAAHGAPEAHDTNGLPETPGANGKSGTNGVNGGAHGAHGANGANGTSRMHGVNGANGHRAHHDGAHGTRANGRTSGSHAPGKNGGHDRPRNGGGSR